MDNFVLFIFGLSITLISGMGVLVYIVNLGYQRSPKVTSPKIAAVISEDKSR